MTPNQHEKNEWSRMAKAAYASDLNSIGHRYSGAAALPNGASIHDAEFDALQAGYRSWLCFNDFKAADYAANRPLYHAHSTGMFR